MIVVVAPPRSKVPVPPSVTTIVSPAAVLFAALPASIRSITPDIASMADNEISTLSLLAPAKKLISVSTSTEPLSTAVPSVESSLV